MAVNGMPVVIVPGFMGSSLDERGTRGRQVWATRSILRTHGLDLMQLDPVGLGPGPLADRDLFPFTLSVAGIYQPLFDRLASKGAAPEYFVWDWRKDCRIAAGQLVTRLLQLHALGAYAVICHSAGAIPTLLAWADLRLQNRTGSLRRVLWLAPDVGGSYAAAVGLAGGLFDAYGWGMLSAFLGITERRFQHPTASLRSQATRLRQSVATWPGLYQLLPSISGQFAAVDPGAADFYSEGNWVESNPFVKQVWLNAARQVQDQVIAAVNGTLPPSVLVLSDPKPTAVQVKLPPYDDALKAYKYSADGDGIVPYPRSRLPGVSVLTVDPDHQSLPGAPGFSSRALDLINDGLGADAEIPPIPLPSPRPADPGGLKPPVVIDFPGLVRRGDP